jgi:hypothetical protein
VTFPVSLPSARVITATATDPSGNTSEFSAADPTGAAGSVQFSVSSLKVIEDLALLNVTVLRTGGNAGALTVDYATADGTAVAGQDYTTTSGTLSFGNGETSKSFTIPILDDATTEQDETFTVLLRNASAIESLGTPNTLVVTVQDHNTVPSFSFSTGAGVLEGNSGTTDLLMTLNLSAATGRSVSVDYATSNFSAFGGTACGAAGVDYESKSGTASFGPGITTVTFPVKICGDTNAETNETFRVNLSNPVNGTIVSTFGIGTIFNDDLLQLLFDESGPDAIQAAALESRRLTRDPFPVISPLEWPGAPDGNTRVILFAGNLQLNPGELPSAVLVRVIGSNGQFIDVPADDVRSLPDTNFTQVVFRLPNGLVPGVCTVIIRAHGQFSNSGTMRIVP